MERYQTNTIQWKTTSELDDIQRNNKQLSSCYCSGFRPPRWSETPMTNHENYKLCKVFYNKQDRITDIKELVEKREPVNIAMSRYYNQSDLNKTFGYEKGIYDTIRASETTGPTPPNFMVYTPSRVKGYGDQLVHILNVIGLAFDNKEQHDYKEYAKIKWNKTKAIHFYETLFVNIFKVAKNLKKKNIVMSMVGANNFASKWEGKSGNIDRFQIDIWLVAWEKAIKNENCKGLSIKFMGAGNTYIDLTRQYENLGFFPQLLKKIDIDDTILINAWDCWSVPGNGNSNDNSLDGYMGRNTEIGYLGTSLTNPYLKKKENIIGL